MSAGAGEIISLDTVLKEIAAENLGNVARFLEVLKGQGADPGNQTGKIEAALTELAEQISARMDAGRPGPSSARPV